MRASENFAWYKKVTLFIALLLLTFAGSLRAQTPESAIDKQFDEIQKKLRVTIDAHLLKTSIEQPAPNLEALNPIYNISDSPSSLGWS